MEILTILSTSSKIISTVATLENRFSIIDKILPLIKGEADIFTIGISGGGKTQFILSLADAFPEPISVNNRTFGADSNKAKFEGKYFNFIDIAGHGHKNISRAEILETKVKKEKCDIIIHVTCYGFAEASIKDCPTKNNLKNWLVENREKEKQMLDEIDYYADFLKPSKIVTLVNKADLWGHYGEDSVCSYYREGSYRDYMKTKRSLCDLEHKVIPYSSISKSFYEGLVKSSIETTITNKYRKDFFKIIRSTNKSRRNIVV